MPLNGIAIAAVDAMHEISTRRSKPSPYVFADPDGEPINDMKLITLTRTLRRTGDWLDPDNGRPFTIHGLLVHCSEHRFSRPGRTAKSLNWRWAISSTVPWSVEYWRDELLDERRALMDGWARHCADGNADVIGSRA